MRISVDEKSHRTIYLSPTTLMGPILSRRNKRYAWKSLDGACHLASCELKSLAGVDVFFNERVTVWTAQKEGDRP